MFEFSAKVSGLSARPVCFHAAIGSHVVCRWILAALADGDRGIWLFLPAHPEMAILADFIGCFAHVNKVVNMWITGFAPALSWRRI